MSAFAHPEFDNHEQIVFCHDAASGLNAIIAIHNTNLGPALGGCRMWPYPSEDEALTDVLRLSRGMTYKAAMADLALGGGKSVIIGDPRTDKTEALLRAFGRYVESLRGRYITAEDVGTTVQDMDIVRQETQFSVGVTGGAGDPSPSTAHGVFVGIKAAVRYKLGKDSTRGLKVAVQGLGSVGFHLCRYLAEDGARLAGSDIDEAAVQRAVKEFELEAVGIDDILTVEADVIAPCALGACLNDASIPEIKAPIIAGAANNQLAEPRHGASLRDRDILFAPDYVINAGGLLDVARRPLDMEIDIARAKLYAIADRLTAIFTRADNEDVATNVVADRMAEERFLAAKAA